MKRKKVALYSLYLDVLGGGEKHILSIMRILSDNGYNPHIFWDKDLTNEIKNRLHLSFSKLNFIPNIFKKTGNFIEKIQSLKDYDIFLYVPDGSYFFSSAKKNFIFSMVPDRKLYPNGLIDKIKTWNYTFISNSLFTQNYLSKWSISSKVIYPYLDDIFTHTDIAALKKDKIILSVGRFFKHLHSKRQDMAIKTFQELKAQLEKFKDYQLVLAGGVKEEDNDYVTELKNLISNDTSISLLPNIPFPELYELYKKASIYWHFAGYGEDENMHPERVEHLGITPLEAMATGNITFCYNAGGPKELITEGKTGFLFNSTAELITKMQNIDKELRDSIIVNAKKFVTDNFSYEIFKKRVLEIFK